MRSLGMRLGIRRGSLGKEAVAERLAIHPPVGPPAPSRPPDDLPGSRAELPSSLEAMAGA